MFRGRENGTPPREYAQRPGYEFLRHHVATLTCCQDATGASVAIASTRKRNRMPLTPFPEIGSPRFLSVESRTRHVICSAKKKERRDMSTRCVEPSTRCIEQGRDLQRKLRARCRARASADRDRRRQGLHSGPACSREAARTRTRCSADAGAKCASPQQNLAALRDPTLPRQGCSSVAGDQRCPRGASRTIRRTNSRRSVATCDI
jgi:hypothetical protein